MRNPQFSQNLLPRIVCLWGDDMFLFVFFICLPLLLIGLCDFLHYLRLLLLSANREPEKYIVFKVKNKADLGGVVSIYEKQRWHGKYFADRLICIHSIAIDKEFLTYYKEKGIVFLEEGAENKIVFDFGEGYGENGASRHG